MKKLCVTIAVLLSFAGTGVAHAQLGGGIVFDPTQSIHALQQILQASQLYTTTVTTAQNVIGAYNLAQQMASSPTGLYRPFLSPSTYWTTIQRSPNVYGNTAAWTNAVNTGSGGGAGYQQATIPRTGQIAGYDALSPAAQRQIAAQGATADLNDAVTSSDMQTLGTIRVNAEKRQTDILTLENATQSMDPAQHTELATLQRINQALVLELQQQQEANQISQASALQQIVAQKQKQDALKATFQQANQFESGYMANAPSFGGAAAAMRY